TLRVRVAPHARRRVALVADELEGLDLLRDAVLEDLEVLRGEPLDDPAILRGIRVDPHEAGSSTEHGALWILRRLREDRCAGRGHDKGEYPAGETRARDHGPLCRQALATPLQQELIIDQRHAAVGGAANLFEPALLVEG